MDDSDVENEFEIQLWREVRQDNIIGDAAKVTVYNLTRLQRDDPEIWMKKRDDEAKLLATKEIADRLQDMTFDVIINKFRKFFDERLIYVRLEDYLKDKKITSVPSVPNEPTQGGITEKDFEFYFGNLMPSHQLVHFAEGCVRIKLTHQADVILSIGRMTLQKHLAAGADSSVLTNVIEHVKNLEFYVKEAHYMADNPNAEMRFDD